MSFDVGDTVSDAWDRFATQAGAVVVVAFAAAGVLQNVAMQDLLRAFLRRLETWYLGSASEQVPPEQVAQFQRSIDQTIAQLPLSMGLSPGVAALLWLGALVLSAAVTVVAIDAFGFSRDRITGIEVEGLGRKTGHVALGYLVILVALFVGFLLFFVPGVIVGLVVVFLLPFYPVAIVLDDESFWSAFGSSLDYARENLGDTIILIMVAIGIFIGVSILSSGITDASPTVAGAVVNQLVSALASVFVLAMLTRAYQSPDTGTPETIGAEGEVHEEWGENDGA